MKKETKSTILAGLLAGSMFLPGCGKKSDCEIPSRHVHKYVKEVTEDISIEQYRDSEKLTYGSYNWTENYIEINKYDEKMYKLLNDDNLFVGADNWNYLYNVMANNHDYLEFYYEYDTIETHVTFDSDGDMHLEIETVHHDGWTKNPRDVNNTGRVRLNHHQYVGYRIINKNGSFELEMSPYVDDMRDIIDEYPYFNEDCTRKVYQIFRFKKSELPDLSPEDFDVYGHPDLSQKTLVLK